MNIMRTSRYITLAACLWALTACGMKKKATVDKDGAIGSQTGSTLSYTEWQLHSISNFDMEPTAKTVTLTFVDSNKRLGGNAGCNGYGGSYKINDNKLQLSELVSTQMACTSGMKTENAFLRKLQEVDNYEISDNHLLLKKGDIVLIQMKKGAKGQK